MEQKGEQGVPEGLVSMHRLIQRNIAESTAKHCIRLFLLAIAMVPLCAQAQLACNLAGKWTDSFGYPWVINPGGLTGTFTIFDSQPSPCFNIALPVTIQVTGSHTFIATATLPFEGVSCASTWVDTLTINSTCTSATGTFATGINSGPMGWTGAGTPIQLSIVSTLPAAQAGVFYPLSGAAELISGGAPQYNVSGITGLGALSLVVDSGTGNVSGFIPMTAWGSYPIGGQVTDTTSSVAPVSVTLNVQCGSPLPGVPADDRDTLLNEYLSFSINLNAGTPMPAATGNCTDFTQQDPSLNVGSPAHPATEKWWVVASLVPARLAAWQALAFDPLNFPSGRPVNSAYRSPLINEAAGGVASSRHVYGDAVDLKTLGKSTSACTANAPAFAMDAACLDIRRVTNTALAAGWDWLETWQPTHYGCQPSRGACVHADMRNTDDTYLNP
jgi:hypothetical protein